MNGRFGREGGLMQTKSIKNPVKIEMCALYLRLSKEDEKGTETRLYREPAQNPDGICAEK